MTLSFSAYFLQKSGCPIFQKAGCPIFKNSDFRIHDLCKFVILFQALFCEFLAISWFWKNKPERVFGLKVRCRELDIFKILDIFGIFLEFFWNFFGFFWESIKIFLGNFWRIFCEEFFGGNFLGGIFWEEFFVYIVKSQLSSYIFVLLAPGYWRLFLSLLIFS